MIKSFFVCVCVWLEFEDAMPGRLSSVLSFRFVVENVLIQPFMIIKAWFSLFLGFDLNSEIMLKEETILK